MKSTVSYKLRNFFRTKKKSRPVEVDTAVKIQLTASTIIILWYDLYLVPKFL